MKIKNFDSALIVLRKPRWADTPSAIQIERGDPNFWYAAGLVKKLLESLWEHALAPIQYQSKEQDDYRVKPNSEEQVYIFIKDQETLEEIAASLGDERTFFSLLETLEISDLVRDVKIWVEREDADDEIPFHEISDGEKQLLSVLGLMRFTAREESLFLLDEPDTHLNPLWKWNYLQLVKEVGKSNKQSHIIMTSHDPLTIGSLKASQVQILYHDDADELQVSPPSLDPKGLGYTSILTQIFGLPTTLDPETQRQLDDRNNLIRIANRTDDQNMKLVKLSQSLKKQGFLIEDREPEYELFLRAYEAVKSDEDVSFSPDEILKKNNMAKEILLKIRADLKPV